MMMRQTIMTATTESAPRTVDCHVQSSSKQPPLRRLWAPNTRRRLAALLIVSAALCPTAGKTEDSATPAASEPDRYDVEIIVFRYLKGSESHETAARLEPADAQQPASDAWSPLEPAALRLTGTASRLRRPGLYRLLYHGGWVQTVETSNRAIRVPMPPAAQAEGVAGTITLYRERYLHVRVDLRLTAEADGSGTFTIQQSRRLRGQAIQYFDNPEFGLILAAREVTAGATGTDPADSAQTMD